MQTHMQNTEYRDVSVAALIESPSNPRKRFDEDSLSELADYVPRHIMQSIFRPASRRGRNRGREKK